MIPTLIFFARSAEKKFLRVVLFLTEEGQATHANPEVGWRVEVGWPYYFLQRRGGRRGRKEGGSGTGLKSSNPTHGGWGTNNKQQTVINERRTTNNEQQTPNSKQQTTNYKQTTNNKQQISNNKQQPTTNKQTSSKQQKTKSTQQKTINNKH